MNEYSGIASVFVGIGSLLICGVIALMFYQIVRLFKSMASKEEKYELLEILCLEKYASKNGIDLEKESIKRDVFKQNNKSIRKKIEEEIYKGMFGKKEKDKEK